MHHLILVITATTLMCSKHFICSTMFQDYTNYRNSIPSRYSTFVKLCLLNWFSLPFISSIKLLQDILVEVYCPVFFTVLLLWIRLRQILGFPQAFQVYLHLLKARLFFVKKIQRNFEED